MKKKMFALIIVTMMLLVGFISVEADKPEDKINDSNGAPSGKHFTLNILGKTWDKGDTADSEDPEENPADDLPDHPRGVKDRSRNCCPGRDAHP